MNTFVRALYVLVVEAILAPFQVLALIGIYIYYIARCMIEFEDNFLEAVKFANSLWVGAKDGLKIVGNYVKTGKITY